MPRCGDRGARVVGRGERDVDYVNVRIVEHVLHPAVGAHGGNVALDDVAPILHQVTDCGNGVEIWQLAQCRQVVEQACASKAHNADAQGAAVELRFVYVLHFNLSLLSLSQN